MLFAVIRLYIWCCVPGGARRSSNRPLRTAASGLPRALQQSARLGTGKFCLGELGGQFICVRSGAAQHCAHLILAALHLPCRARELHGMWSALCARAAPEPERLAALAGARAVAQRSASPAARELIYLAEREADVLGRRVPAPCSSAWNHGVRVMDLGLGIRHASMQGGTMAPASLPGRSCLGRARG